MIETTQNPGTHTLSKRQTWRVRRINEGDHWKCIHCGSCCSWDFSPDWLSSLFPDATQTLNRYCTNSLAFEGKTVCGSYRARPNACRAFPFTLEADDIGFYALVAHENCQGFGAGRTINVRKKILQVVSSANREYRKRIRVDDTVYPTTGKVKLVS
ncbi:MAG: hypothetical protein ABH834_05830 [Candidatus Altiarchaeota archaeon]